MTLNASISHITGVILSVKIYCSRSNNLGSPVQLRMNTNYFHVHWGRLLKPLLKTPSAQSAQQVIFPLFMISLLHTLIVKTNTQRSVMNFFALCKGIHDSRGFWIPPCGFRIPSTGFRIPAHWIPDSKTAWIPNFFFCFNAFLRISFSCSNLAILKDVVQNA